MAIIIIVLLFIVVDIAALLWGADSRDNIDRCECCSAPGRANGII